MMSRSRSSVRSVVAAAAAVSLALVAGCGTQGTSPVGPGTTVIVPAPDTRGAERDIQKIEKAVTPPVVVGPGAPTTPAPTPAPAPAPAK